MQRMQQSIGNSPIGALMKQDRRHNASTTWTIQKSGTKDYVICRREDRPFVSTDSGR